MKKEDEIFKEWYELRFEEPPSPPDYMYLRDTLDFQRYLLWYRYTELVELIREEFLKPIRKLISKFRK